MKNEEEAFFKAKEILERAKGVLEVKRDSELAAKLGVSRSTLCNWIARNSVDLKLLLTRLPDVDYNWLLTGNGSPRHHSCYCDNELVSGEVEILQASKTTEVLDDRSVTLYDIRAAANLRTLLDDKPQYALGKIEIPHAPKCDGAVYVSGDSMYPLLKSGDIIGFKSVTDFSEVIWGGMYLISFSIGDEEYLAVKYIRRSDVSGCIELASFNPNHSPMDIPLSSIHSLAVVKFSIRRDWPM